MSFLHYAASGVLRNRRRMFASVVGVLLAVTFVAGTFIAIDSSARATLDASLQGLQGDFSYSALPPETGPPFSGGLLNGTDLRDALAAIPGVTDASVYRQIDPVFGEALLLYNPHAALNNSFPIQQLTAVDSRHLPTTLRTAAISGSTQMPNGTALLDSQTAANLQVKLGDTVGVLTAARNGTGYVNHSLTFLVEAVATLPPPSSYGGNLILGPSPGDYGALFAFNLRDIDWVAGSLALTSQTPQIQGEIWIDRARFVNPYDLQATVFQLARLSRQLTQAMIQAGYSGQIGDEISPAIGNFQSSISSARVQYLLLSVPVILLGLYLGAVGVDLGHTERRRELGVLKARGASERQVVSVLILESLIGGSIAAVLGLLLGAGVSRFLVGAVTPFGTTPADTSIALTPITVFAVVLMSFAFMGLATYRSAKRAAGLPVVETLRYYAPEETHIRYSPTADIAFVGYSVLAYATYWYVTSNPGNFFTFTIAIPFLVTLPATPVLLTIGLVRLLTRSTGQVYEWTSRLMRPFARNLEYIVSRNLSRNPRRSSNVAIIITFGLAFGIFAVSSLASQQLMQEQSLRASIGADMSVTPPFGFNLTAAEAFGSNLSRVSGIAGITHILRVNAFVAPTPVRNTPSIVAIDPSTYFAVSRPSPFFFETPADQGGAERALATVGQVLVTGQFARDAAVQLGDPLVLSITTYPNGTQVTTSLNVRVGGVVRFLPGTYSGYFFGFTNAPDEVYGSYATLGKLIAAQDSSGGPGLFSSDRFLAALQEGADWQAVKASVVAMGSPKVDVYPELRPQLADTPALGSLIGFVHIEIAFIVVILTAGLALIIYAASLERKVEFAGINARGSSGWQTAGLLVGEAFSIMVIGVVVGLAVGVLSGYLSVSFTYGGISAYEPMIPNLFEFPLAGLWLVVLAAGAMLGATLLVAWRIARMNVARVLKMRGG